MSIIHDVSLTYHEERLCVRWSGWQRMISTSLGATVHHIMNCIRQKQQLDALALFIDFAAAHTNPTPSSPRQIQRKHVCTTWQLPHWFCLLFVDLVCWACTQTLAKRLTLTSRTFVYSWTGAIFIRAMHKVGLFSNRRVALNMWPLWIQMSEEKNACTLRRSSFSVPENLRGEWIPAEQEHGSW